MFAKFILFSILTLSFASKLWSEPPLIEFFDGSAASFASWESHSFEGETDYRLIEGGRGSAQVIRAVSKASASGLVIEKEVDLRKTPYLNWEWRVDEALGELEETTKAGDDYAARVYVIVSGGWLFWRTKALNFVWSGRDAKGESWPNAFAPDNALMLVLRGVNDPHKKWVSEKINVREKLSEWLEEDVDTIHAVAIMTDTDNSGGRAQAQYGPIYFSDK